MNRIIYTRPEGTVTVEIPTAEFKGTMEELAEKVVPVGIAYEIVDETDIPTDRTFRNAWKHDTSTAPEKIAVDMVKAAEIAHKARRKERDKLFAPLDIKATIPAEANAAETARQSIRDADAQKQTAIDAATTPEELKVLMETPLVGS